MAAMVWGFLEDNLLDLEPSKGLFTYYWSG